MHLLLSLVSVPPAKPRLARITPVAAPLRTLLRLLKVHLLHSAVLVLPRHPILQVSVQLALVVAALPAVALPALERAGGLAARVEGHFAVEGGVDGVHVRVGEGEAGAVDGVEVREDHVMELGGDGGEAGWLW